MGNKLLNPVYDVSDEFCSLSGRLLKGVVKDTKDELNLSRVRVDLGRWTKDIPVEHLPYAFPLFGIRGQSFPKMDETVLVISTSDDLKSLLYTQWPGHSEFNANNLHGFVDNFGSLFVYDTSTGDYTFWHKNGSQLKLTGEGKLTVKVKDLTLSALNSMTIKTKTLKMSCTIMDVQASNSITETTQNKINNAAMITDSSSGSPSPEQPDTLEAREG